MSEKINWIESIFWLIILAIIVTSPVWTVWIFLIDKRQVSELEKVIKLLSRADVTRAESLMCKANADLGEAAQLIQGVGRISSIATDKFEKVEETEIEYRDMLNFYNNSVLYSYPVEQKTGRSYKEGILLVKFKDTNRTFNIYGEVWYTNHYERRFTGIGGICIANFSIYSIDS